MRKASKTSSDAPVSAPESALDDNLDEAVSSLDKYKTLAKENMESDRLEEAQRCLEKAVYIAISAFGPGHEEVGTNLRDLGSVMHQRGMHEAAEPLMARAERILRAAG